MNSWATFGIFTRLLRKEYETYVKAIRNYNVRQAGGRQIMASLVKSRYSMSLTLYVVLMVQIENFENDAMEKAEPVRKM